jgi:hypothetical protein
MMVVLFVDKVEWYNTGEAEDKWASPMRGGFRDVPPTAFTLAHVIQSFNWFGSKQVATIGATVHTTIFIEGIVKRINIFHEITVWASDHSFHSGVTIQVSHSSNHTSSPLQLYAPVSLSCSR